jgi:hypothetical protein
VAFEGHDGGLLVLVHAGDVAAAIVKRFLALRTITSQLICSHKMVPVREKENT